MGNNAGVAYESLLHLEVNSSRACLAAAFFSLSIQHQDIVGCKIFVVTLALENFDFLSSTKF